jgi:hypothetical protein
MPRYRRPGGLERADGQGGTGRNCFRAHVGRAFKSWYKQFRAGEARLEGNKRYAMAKHAQAVPLVTRITRWILGIIVLQTCF